MTSGCSGTLCFRRRDRELVLKPCCLLWRGWGGATSFILSVFFALLSRSLPAVSQIPGHIEDLPPPPMESFYSSSPIEGCNRKWALRILYSIHDRRFRAAKYVCFSVRIEREQIEQRTNRSLQPKAWVCSADCAFNICKKKTVPALGEIYRGPQVTCIKPPHLW